MTDRVTVFISHISEEAPLAHSLKSWIEATFPDQVSVFVSSDLVSIQAGDEWYDKIMEALGATSVFIVVCSPTFSRGLGLTLRPGWPPIAIYGSSLFVIGAWCPANCRSRSTDSKEST